MKFSKSTYKIPNFLIISMKYMCTILMNTDSIFIIVVIAVPTNMTFFVNYLYIFPCSASNLAIVAPEIPAPTTIILIKTPIYCLKYIFG